MTVTRYSALAATAALIASLTSLPLEIAAQATSAGPRELVLGDFEGAVERLFQPNTRGTSFNVVKEHATRGLSSLKVTCTGRYPGLQISRAQDWSGYTLLRFDVFNPGDANLPLYVDMRDQESLSDGAWSNRFGKTLYAEPGRSELELNVTSLKCNQKARLIDVSRLRTVLFFIGKVEGTRTFFIDNIRLVKPDKLEVPNSFAFDFGSKGSPVFAGFTAASDTTIHGQGQKWGWARKLYDARNRAGTPEALTTDFVRADGEFRIEVPNGRYKLWLIRADSGDWGWLQHWSRRIIKAEGRTLSDESMSRQDFYDRMLFASLNREDLPGGDLWKKYITPRWKEETYEASVADGRLDLQFQGDSWGNTLNCLVVYPTEHAREAEEWLKRVNQAREANFRKTFTELVPGDGKLVKAREKDGTVIWKPVEDPTQRFYEPTAADQERGYVVFARPYTDTVYPKSRPRPGELAKEATCALAKGEYEPLTFSLYPLRDLGEVSVELSELRSDKGGVLPKDSIQPNWVQYKIHRAGLHSTAYRCVPRLLRKGNRAPGHGGVCRRFWFTFHGPEAVQGTFRGKARIKAAKGGEHELDIVVRVRPFALEERSDRYFVLCSSARLPQEFTWYRDTEGAWKRLEERWKDYRAHGFNFIHTGLKGENLDQLIRLTQKYGSADTIKIGCAGFQRRSAEGALERFLAFARPYQKMAKERKWPRVTYVLLDEPANEGDLRTNALKVMEALQPARKEGILLTGDINGRNDQVFFKWMDYSGMNDGLNICPATLKSCRDAGSVPWLVNTGKKRFYWGYWFYKASEEFGVEYKEDYAYMTWHGDPFFDLDQWNPDFCASFPGPDGPINSPWFEECREGIDDFRYLSMLGKLAKRTGDAEAQNFLKQLLSPVNLDLSENVPWPGRQCDDAREKVAQLIEKLSAAPAR